MVGMKTPKVEPPARMPDPEDPAVLEARRQKIDQMRARGGRQSTILSDALQTRNPNGSIGKLGA